MATFVCQQCKQPLQLDPSLMDMPQSAYDSVVAALPKSFSESRFSRTSVEDRLSRVDIPDSAKSAISRHARTPSSPTATVSAPSESFVMLKDSIVQNTPTDSPSPPFAKSRRPPLVVTTGQFSPPGKSMSSPATPRAGTPSRPTRSGMSAGPLATPRTASRNMDPSTPITAIRLEPGPAPRVPPPSKMTASRLFQMLSSRTDVDHPMCAECTHLLLEGLHSQLEETKKERDGYIAFERDVKKQKLESANSGDAQEKETLRQIEKLKIQETEAISRLQAAEREHAQLEAELVELEMEEKALEEEEADFWTAYSAASMEAVRLQDMLTSLEHAHAANELELAKLSRTNVYNDAFCIGHDGVFGTINGLRLGRSANVQVEWSEINAAWGMTVLLLSTIARKVGFVFETWKLVPIGSFSGVQKIGGDKTFYELYGSSDLISFIHNRRFDNAMVAFLDCLKQLMDYACLQDSRVEFPQIVNKDKIGEASIKLQFGQDEAWTRALRHVLLALKLLLKWATHE